MKNLLYSHHHAFDDDFDESFLEKSKRSRHPPRVEGSELKPKKETRQSGFRCAACKGWVSAERDQSGVNHRNHCPLCLASLHLDLKKAGDRLSACRSRMEPIGLTFKHVNKRYPLQGRGELMLIHRCTGCGKIDINRVAADDDPEALYTHAKASLVLPEVIQKNLSVMGIMVLDANGFDAAYAQIYGRQPIEVELSIWKSVELND